MCAKLFWRALGIVFCGRLLTAAAETNSTAQADRLSILPKPQLRAESTDPHWSLTETSPAHLETLHSDSFILSAGHGDGEVQHYRHFDIIRPAHESDDRLTRGLDSIFRPEEFHIGKTTVTCSLLTAIKRKNPLCLINPIFLQVSW